MTTSQEKRVLLAKMRVAVHEGDWMQLQALLKRLPPETQRKLREGLAERK